MAKAEAAELKANDASDDIAREQAWREASRLWERAAERETDAKRRKLYEANAEQARAQADAPQHEVEPEPSADSPERAPEPSPERAKTKLLN